MLFSQHKFLFAAVVILFIAGAGIGMNSLSSTVGETYTPPATELPTTQTPVTETPATETPVAPSGISMAQVASHNSAESCYIVVAGSVYDVTSFITKHPGGPSRILKQCGTDATEEFMDQHGGDSRPESALATFKIAALAN